MANPEQFEDMVVDAFKEIPEKFRAKVKNVAFIVEDEPSETLRKEHGLSRGETLLGFYRGVPRTVRGVNYGVGPTLPDLIVIYKLPCEQEAFGSGRTIESVVKDTVFHEVGHYLGMSEREVRSWERKKRSASPRE